MKNYILTWVIPIIVCYLLGSIPTGLIISKIKNDDIRKHGSGNIGSTNMTRTYGKNVGKITFAGDILKAILAWIICTFMFTLPTYNSIIVQSFTVIGHCFSIFLKFKGGKGVASSVALAFLNNPLLGLIPILTWILTYFTTKIVSLASILAFIILNIVVLLIWLLTGNFQSYLFLVTICNIIIIIRHIDNIKRLIKNEENTFK